MTISHAREPLTPDGRSHQGARRHRPELWARWSPLRDTPASRLRCPLPTSLRACASRRSRPAAGSAVPAVAGPGTTDEPAADDGGIGQRQPELHDQAAAFGAPAQLAVLVGPGMGALHRPAAARMNRGWHAPRGDLADHAASGQYLSAGLVVVAGV